MDYKENNLECIEKDIQDENLYYSKWMQFNLFLRKQNRLGINC